MRMMRTMLLGFALVSTFGVLRAQTPATAWSKRETAGSRKSLLVVTRGEPLERKPCHIKRVVADRLECGGRWGKVTAIYRRDEVLALLDRPGNGGLRRYTLWALGIGGGMLMGATLLMAVCTPAGVVLAVVGGMVILTIGAAAIGDNNEESERLLYLRDGGRLDFPLRH